MKIYLNSKIIVFVFLFITACNLKRGVVTNNNLNNINIEDLIKNVNKNTISKDWITIRGKITINSNKENIALGANIKIRKDSLVWLSITAPIIGEVSRVMISKDSVYYINRSNSTWMIKSIDYASKQINVDLSYTLIEQIITSAITLPETNYLSEVNGDRLVIKDNLDSSSYVVDIMYNYIKEANLNFRENNCLQIRYSGLQMFDQKHYPKELNVISSNNSFNLGIKYSKIKSSNKEKVLFNIPESYNEIN